MGMPICGLRHRQKSFARGFRDTEGSIEQKWGSEQAVEERSGSWCDLDSSNKANKPYLEEESGEGRGKGGHEHVYSESGYARICGKFSSRFGTNKSCKHRNADYMARACSAACPSTEAGSASFSFQR
jgi:hypothetical protein